MSRLRNECTEQKSAVKSRVTFVKLEWLFLYRFKRTCKFPGKAVTGQVMCPLGVTQDNTPAPFLLAMATVAGHSASKNSG